MGLKPAWQMNTTSTTISWECARVKAIPPAFTSLVLLSVFRRWINPRISCTRAFFPRAWTPSSAGRSNEFWRLNWRGESETIASPIAQVLRYAGGRDVLVRILCAIGRDPKLQRTFYMGRGKPGKMAVFSHLIRVTMPAKDDTPEAFAADVKAEKISENVLLAVAFYAPQWARPVQEAIGWPMFVEAVWWFHAHTKDPQWQVEMHVRESWNAEIRKLTPLELSDLMEGAVDVDWFHRTYEALGPERWKRLDEFAKYASGGGGHKRAQLFAQAMLGTGRQTRAGARGPDQAQARRDPALGLLPLDPKAHREDVLARFKVMQEFVRTSRQFGSNAAGVREAGRTDCAGESGQNSRDIPTRFACNGPWKHWPRPTSPPGLSSPR